MQQQNLKILVLAKQVPDTRNVGKDAMTPEGTVNRAALPAIFNPEDRSYRCTSCDLYLSLSLSHYNNLYSP